MCPLSTESISTQNMGKNAEVQKSSMYWSQNLFFPVARFQFQPRIFLCFNCKVTLPVHSERNSVPSWTIISFAIWTTDSFPTDLKKQLIRMIQGRLFCCHMEALQSFVKNSSILLSVILTNSTFTLTNSRFISRNLNQIPKITSVFVTYCHCEPYFSTSFSLKHAIRTDIVFKLKISFLPLPRKFSN